jgi:hypothetical protein
LSINLPAGCALRARTCWARRRGRTVFPNRPILAGAVTRSAILRRPILGRSSGCWIAVCNIRPGISFTSRRRAPARRRCSIVGGAGSAILTSWAGNRLSRRHRRWMVSAARCPCRHSAATKFRGSHGGRYCGAPVIHRSEELPVGAGRLLVLNLRSYR